jgi:D-psicose/D-tagatose/L-ribulose 3-epimerase
VFTGKAPTDQERAWAKENLYALAEYAQQYGIVLGLEYLNRFESYLVTTSDELIQLVDDINHPNCKLMFDSFHANIEEQSLSKAIQKMGNRLVHVQLSENDRGILGRGHLDFTTILQNLEQIGYKGMVSVEAFSTKLAAANIWRKMFNNEMELVTESYQYLKSVMHEN